MRLAILFAIILYAIGIASTAGKLPNQTATLKTVDKNSIFSLSNRENYALGNISLQQGAWNIRNLSGTTVSAYNDNGNLVIKGKYKNSTLPFFIAKNSGINLNVTDNSYLHLSVNSTPDTLLSFCVGIRNLDPWLVDKLRSENQSIITEDDKANRITWVNISYPTGGVIINGEDEYLTINLAAEMENLGLRSWNIEGLGIMQRLIGFLQPSSSSFFETVLKSINFSKEIPYAPTTANGTCNTLLDGSAAAIIRNNSVGRTTDLPYLQRAYISYKMNSSQNTLYTMFLVSKDAGNLTAQRIGFVFTHNNALNEIGTYIDWRKPIELDHHFEPVASLDQMLTDGDFALVFSPLRNNAIQSIQLNIVVFTFSKLPYSAFAISSINEETLIAASVLILTLAGTLPTFLVFYLFYLQGKGRLICTRNTVVTTLLIGLGIRLFLALFTAYADDTQIFAQIGAIYFGSGVLGAQWVSLPGFVYLEVAAYFPYSLLRAGGFHDFQFLALDIYGFEALFTKLPAILADFGSFFFIFKMAEKHVPNKKILLPALYLLNPLTIYVSGILGQFDSIFVFALIAGTYYLITRSEHIRAALLSSFGAILNPVGLAAFVPLFTDLLKKRNLKKTAECLVIAVIIFVGALLPFFFEARSPVIVSSYERVLAGIPAEAFYGKQINFYLYGRLIASSVGYGLTFRFFLEMLGVQLGPAIYPFGAGFVFVIFVGIFIWRVCKAQSTKSDSLVYSGTFMLVVAAIFQLTFPTIFDQFAIWIAALLLVSYALTQNRILILLFTIVCITDGFVYVLTWRNYLQLISGVEAVPLGNTAVSSFGSAMIGMLYSSMLIVIVAIVLKMWFKKHPIS